MSAEVRRSQDPTPHLIAVAAALARPGQPDAALAALDAALEAAIGHRLFTVLVVNLERAENQRAYSSRPDAYPVGGAKPIVRDGVVTRRVIGEGLPHINRTYADVQAVFPDHALIRSLGCESSINVPVRWDGRTYGMLNLLHEAGYDWEARVPALTAFAGLAVPIVQHIVRGWPSAGSGP